MAAIVEPVVTREKACALLAEQCEQPCLDYKRCLDLATTRDLVELAKDVAAMQSEPAGGYILVGADDRGSVHGALTKAHTRHFDDATLRQKLAKYLTEPRILSGCHQIGEHWVVLVYVYPSVHGYCILHALGEYEDESASPGKKRKHTVFRSGEVFVRHGTRSERWTDADRERILEQQVAQRKEEWRREWAQQWRAQLDTALGTARLEQLVAELMRRGDDIALRTLINQADRDADALFPDELARLLDRFTIVAALAVDYDRPVWLSAAIGAMVRVYELGFPDPHPRAVWLWVEIMQRVYGLGALAVRAERWPAVRLLADRQPQDHAVQRYGGWVRHALTMAARAKLVDDEDGRLIARTHNTVRAISALRSDRGAEHDSVLSSLCQFDLYGCLAVMGEQGSTEARLFNPGFARYYSKRTDPAFERIATDPAVRAALFDGDDAFLAAAISTICRYAREEAFRFDGWEGIASPAVRRFLQEHAADQSAQARSAA